MAGGGSCREEPNGGGQESSRPANLRLSPADDPSRSARRGFGVQEGPSKPLRALSPARPRLPSQTAVKHAA